MLAMRTKKELDELYKQVRRDYLAGDLADISLMAIAEKYSITWVTAKRWLAKIQPPIKEKKFQSLITELPADWQWIKLAVNPQIKNQFDNLSNEKKILLYKLLDTELKTDIQFDSPIIEHNINAGPTTKTIAIKVSPGAIAIWKSLPTIRKNNQFSRASWAINKVISPFLRLMLE